MGHTRLGTIPKTRPWKAVVAALTSGPEVAGRGDNSELRTPDDWGSAGADIALLADQTLQVARGGLESAKADPGLLYTVYLLTQLALASRGHDWQKRLELHGISLSADATLLDLTTEFQASIDDWVARRRHRSDFNDMAQRAAGEALSSLAGTRAHTLFGNSGEELRLAIRALSTREGFAELGQAFFGHFLSGFLNFYLSRVTAAHLGEGRFRQIGDLSVFNDALATHCHQSARIVRDFAGQWYSKTEYQRGIDLSNTAGFVAVALTKLQEELRLQRADVGSETGRKATGSKDVRR